jgi:hypothetical protein
MTAVELHLRVVGVLLLLLVALNVFAVPRRLGWKRDLAALSLVNRQIFQVHAAFICLVLAMFAGLTLLLPRELLAPTPLARAVLGGLAAFWFARLLVQWFVYDPRLWRGKRFETVVHVVFTGVWFYFTATFALALWVNVRG